MLVIPDEILIQLVTENGEQFKQDKILIGIHTFATRKLNIELFPFISNNKGEILITKSEIQEAGNNFIDYGIMDYSPLESASPDVVFYLFTKEQIEKYINYWEPKANRVIQEYPWMNMYTEEKKKEIIKELNYIKARENEKLLKFKTCCNLNLNTEVIEEKKVKWDGSQKTYVYEMIIKQL